MRPVVPTGDFPDNVRPAKFKAPEGMEDDVNDIAGLLHLDDAGEPQAMEFMFELSEAEIKVLKHEPYVTMTVMADHLHPFAIQTSYPPDPKFDSLDEHTHICDSNMVHEENKWWRCDSPNHDKIKDRNRECDDCWSARQHMIAEHGDTTN